MKNKYILQFGKMNKLPTKRELELFLLSAQIEEVWSRTGLNREEQKTKQTHRWLLIFVVAVAVIALPVYLFFHPHESGDVLVTLISKFLK